MFAFYLLITIVPQEILQHYTFDGRIQLQPLYAHAENGDSIKFKNANLQAIHEGKKAQIWSRENIEASQEIYRKDIMRGIYGIEVNMTKLIKEYMIEQVFIYVKKLLFLKNMYYQVFQGICVWYPNLSLISCNKLVMHLETKQKLPLAYMIFFFTT